MHIPVHELSVAFCIGWALFAITLWVIKEPSFRLAEIASLLALAAVGSVLFSIGMFGVGLVIAESNRALIAMGVSADHAETGVSLGLLVVAYAATIWYGRLSRRKAQRAAN